MPPVSRRLLPATLLAIALPLLAQQGAVAFKHFHRYPTSGQWATEGHTTMGGKPMGAPVSSTACASPLSPGRLAAIKKMGNDAAPACTITVLRDEERTAEYEQVCTTPQQTIHSTLHAVDDKTITMEVRLPAPGGAELVTHTTSHYLGACTAAQTADSEAAAAAPLPSVKLSPEDCAELASNRQQAEEALKNCDAGDFPESERATCRSTMAGLLQRVKTAAQSCTK